MRAKLNFYLMLFEPLLGLFWWFIWFTASWIYKRTTNMHVSPKFQIVWQQICKWNVDYILRKKDRQAKRQYKSIWSIREWTVVNMKREHFKHVGEKYDARNKCYILESENISPSSLDVSWELASVFFLLSITTYAPPPV